MGNSMGCFIPPKITHHSPSKNGLPPPPPLLPPISDHDDALIRRQAIEAVLLFRQHHNNENLVSLDRSASVRDNNSISIKNNTRNQLFPRSHSVRPTSRSDSLLPPPTLLPQPVPSPSKEEGLHQGMKDIVDNHVVLVHGAGYGAWCWYKTISLLHKNGFLVDAIDLAGSGIDSFDPNNVTSIQQYVKPLIDFLGRLDPGKKVMLVGHDFGGICISYAMEMFPCKVSKAVFIAAAMVGGGQSAIHLFSSAQQKTGVSTPVVKMVVHGNGKLHPPTSVVLDHHPLFNKSPEKDIALASVSMRPIPYGPMMERLTITEEKYGCVPRFYIKTDEDISFPIAMQETMIEANPPQQVFLLKASDHSPFFSKPQSLHRLLLTISNIS